jgi:hypothetical protein
MWIGRGSLQRRAHHTRGCAPSLVSSMAERLGWHCPSAPGVNALRYRTMMRSRPAQPVLVPSICASVRYIPRSMHQQRENGLTTRFIAYSSSSCAPPPS